MNKDEAINKIQRDLEELKSLIIILNQNDLETKKNKLLPSGTIKKQIYDLCDGSKNISELARSIGKSNEYTGSYLSRLRREGLIRKIEKDGEIYHEQIF
jgi:hypothetical protein